MKRVTLRFLDHTPENARWMLGLAEAFAAAYGDRRAGESVVYTQGEKRAEVYWTQARTVVVREIVGEVAA